MRSIPTLILLLAVTGSLQANDQYEQNSLAERAAGGGAEPILVLYKPTDEGAVPRTTEGVDTATRVLESSLSEHGYRPMQPPDVNTQAILDKGPGTLVSFAPDAGLSMLISAKKRELPIPGDARRTQTEFSLGARVYCGPNLLYSPREAYGKAVTLKTSLAQGYELAAEKAATLLAEHLVAELDRQRAERGNRQGGATRLCEGQLQRLIRQHQAATTTPATALNAQVQMPQPDSAIVHGMQAEKPPAAAIQPVSRPEPLAPPKRVWALLVGISDFAPARARMGLQPGQLGDLRAVSADMELMKRTLDKKGVPPGNVVSLMNAQATTGNFRAQLRRLQQQAESDDLVLVYISSHGMAADVRESSSNRPSLSGYGLPVFHDFDLRDGNTLLDFWEIQSLLLNTRARQVVWLVDTCHAGGAAIGMRGGSVLQRALAPQRVEVSAQGVQRVDAASAVFNAQQAAQVASQVAEGRHIAIISAATPEQYALEKANGLFTYRFAEGLGKVRGPVTVEKLFRDHVERQVAEDARKLGRTQQPVIGKSGRGGEIRLFN